MRIWRIIAISVASLFLLFLLLQILPPQKVIKDAQRTIKTIPTPIGYERIEDDSEQTIFLRNLPLKDAPAKVQKFTGGDYTKTEREIIDLPLLSRSEQCADVAMRLRAEYLYSQHKYLSIRFPVHKYVYIRYLGGSSRYLFEWYLKLVYKFSGTHTLTQTLQPIDLNEIRIGDMYVYNRHGNGHAVTIADICVNSLGEKRVLLVEGCGVERHTNSLEMHTLRHIWYNPKEPQSFGYKFQSTDAKRW